MTDYDRGAYTPQTDAPLAFDPRRPSERRPVPMALIGSAAVLVILLAGVAMVYRGGVRHAGESPRPVGEPVMAVKTAPPSADSASTPPANADVYSEAQGSNALASATAPARSTTPVTAGAAAPVFTPPAEQPAARSAPNAATVAMLAKPTAPSQIERPPTPSETVASAPSAPAPTAAAKPAVAPAHVHTRPKPDASELAAAGATGTETQTTLADTSTPAVHRPRPVASEAPASSPPSTMRSAPGKVVVQIGAFSSSALAEKGYADVSAALPDRMTGKFKHMQPLDKDGATLYRTWLSGFATRADAEAFCEALKAKGKTCLVKG